MSKFSIKRLLPVLAGVGVVAASASSVVSCTQPIYAAGEDGQRVVVATDGGHINDKSFNQDAYLGVNNFVKDAYGLDGTDDYVEAGGTDTASIISGYLLAILKKANTIVTPGFSHVNTLPSVLSILQKHNINVVLVDGILKAPNVVSIQFNSQISGVMAGFDTSYMLGTTLDKGGHMYVPVRTEVKDKKGNLVKDEFGNQKYTESFQYVEGSHPHYDTNGDGKIKIGTFAGASNKYGVDNYMWGLLLGMEIYNQVAIAHNTDKTAQQWSAVESGNTTDGTIQSVLAQNDTDPDYYTNSFALGDATKSGMVSKLVDTNKSDVVFPVAGPQIQDVLGYKNATPYVIGVDVDQAAAFPKGNGRFITSAIKNIDTAVPEALYRARNDDDPNSNTLKPGTKDTSNSKYGGWNSAKNDHWLGSSPEPFVNWSIDFADGEAPSGGNYLLKKHYIKLYGDDMQTTAKYAMAEINEHFAIDLGDKPADYTNKKTGKFEKGYMNGEDIYAFAQSLISKYGSSMSDEVLDWFKVPSNGGDK